MNAHLIRLSRLWALCGGGILLLIVTVSAVNAGAFTLDFITRAVGIRIPALSGYEDFVRLTVGTAMLMMMPHCQIQRGHICVTLLTKKLSAAARQTLDTVWRILTAAVAVFLAGALTLGMAETYTDNTLSPILGWREWLFYPPAVASLFLWALVTARHCRAADG